MSNGGDQEGAGGGGGGVRVYQDWRALFKGEEQPQVLLSSPSEGPLFLFALVMLVGLTAGSCGHQYPYRI